MALPILLFFPNPTIALTAVLALVACTQSPPSGAGQAEAHPPTGNRTYTYQCGDERIVAQFESDAIRLFLGDQQLHLPQVVAASGVRYSDGITTFWTKGDSARLTTPNRTYPECRGQPVNDPWEAARLRGVDFRAIGQEPGWLLEIDQGRQITLLADYGERRVVTPAPTPDSDPPARRTVYRVQTEAHDLLVTIQTQPCRDIMSGEAFPAEVTIRLDGREYRGCGRALPEHNRNK